MIPNWFKVWAEETQATFSKENHRSRTSIADHVVLLPRDNIQVLWKLKQNLPPYVSCWDHTCNTKLNSDSHSTWPAWLEYKNRCEAVLVVICDKPRKDTSISGSKNIIRVSSWQLLRRNIVKSADSCFFGFGRVLSWYSTQGLGKMGFEGV